MRERQPLDLSKILPQYSIGETLQPQDPVLPGDGGGGLCFEQAPVHLGQGPLSWSTSTALVPVEPVCHDVNGYYRELGVDWRASRRELAVAYMEAGGMGSHRLTYVFKQLLNIRIREEYDRMPAGSVFLDDYTDPQKRIKRKAQQEAARRVVRGEMVSADQILDDWGFEILPEDRFDNVKPIGKDLDHRDEPWDYSYYAWKTSSYRPDQYRLRRWQELLSTAASQRGVSPEMIIGSTALSDRPFRLENVNGSPVIFFSEGTAPSLSVATDAIDHTLQYAH